jgi:hypothetical protein
MHHILHAIARKLIANVCFGLISIRACHIGVMNLALCLTLVDLLDLPFLKGLPVIPRSFMEEKHCIKSVLLAKCHERLIFHPCKFILTRFRPVPKPKHEKVGLKETNCHPSPVVKNFMIILLQKVGPPPLVITVVGTDKNTKLTVLSQRKLALTAKNTLFALGNQRSPPKNLKTSRVPYLGLFL